MYKKYGLIALLLAIVVVGIWWKIASSPAQTNTPFKRGLNNITPVQVATVNKSNFPVYINALGTVTAYNTVNVVSRVQGELVNVLFTEGQAVKQGDILAEIDPRPYQTQLLQAKGSEKQNKALLQKAQSELNRYRKLIKQDSIARQTYESQVALVNQYQGAVMSSQAQIEQAQLDLEFTKIKAPISGKIGIRQIDIGNYIRVGDSTPLVVITQIKPIAVTFTLPEAKLPAVATQLKQGNKLQVQAWDSTNNQLLATGVVEALDNQINTSTGTIMVKAQFDNQDEMLFPNQFVNIKLKLTELQDQLVIPTDAIQYGNKGNFVYVVNDDIKVRLQYVTLGESDADKTTVLEGLKENEKVVIQGTDRLRENSKVEIISPASSVTP